MKYPSKFLSLVTSLLVILLLLSAAIAVPILCRPFYYAQIDSLSLAEQTGWSREVIAEAYDQVMDYLVKGAPFGTGLLRWSQEGMEHFADCKALFKLDFLILGGSAALLLLIALLSLRRELSLYHFRKKGPCFWALVGMTAAVAVLGVWAAVDFTSLFTAFHTCFFPGKTNWIFDWQTDEIILILPEIFWARTAALIALLAFGGGVLLALVEGIILRRRPQNLYEELKKK